MIEVLRIKNLALIDDLELECGPGLNVLTGETGAGKSFIISAVNFLTGEKMHTDLVLDMMELALRKTYGIRIDATGEALKAAFANVRSLARFVAAQRALQMRTV